MRDYSKISPVIWASKRFRNLPSDDARFLHLYLLSNTHQNSIGCYRLPPAYGWVDLDWPEEKYLSALAALIEASFIDFDADTSEVLIHRWLRHNPVTNVNHAKGALGHAERVESERLKDAVFEELFPFLDRWGVAR